MSEIVIFEDDARKVEVRLEGETVWLTQRQMAELFGTTSENVLMHLRNIFREDELDEAATTKDFLAVRQEGHRRVQRRLKTLQPGCRHFSGVSGEFPSRHPFPPMGHHGPAPIPDPWLQP